MNRGPRTEGRLSPSHPQPSRRALVDLAWVAGFTWLSLIVILRYDVPAALSQFASANQEWAIDDFTLVSLCAVTGLGIFAWRRWQESLEVIARHEATLERLRNSEDEIESKDRLIRSVSHELRTPLTALLGYAQLLGDSAADELDREDAVRTIVAQGRDLSNIVDDLLTRAQAEAATLRLATVSLSLGAQAAQVVESWGTDWEDDIRLQVDREVRAVGDPARVRQIVRNLVSNGLRYGTGPVHLATAATESRAILTVSNRGAAIPDEHRERIFDPYHRVQPDDHSPGGLGLGLAISLQLAQLMGGDITYTHHDGRSNFHLSLPRS